jgi:hypothetical protein
MRSWHGSDSGWQGRRSVCLGCPEYIVWQDNPQRVGDFAKEFPVNHLCGHFDACNEDGEGKRIPDPPFTPGWCPWNWWLDAMAGKIQKQETLF